jgi:hypothetical protein
MTWGDDVAQSPSPTEPKRGRPTRVWHIFENRLIHVSREVGGVGQWRPRRLVGRQRVWSGSRPSAPNNLKLALEILLTSYKYPPYPLSLEEIRKWGLASYSARKFILCTIERERGEVLRARELPGLVGLHSVARAWKLCQNPFWIDGVFQALVRSSAGALLEFCEFRQRTDSRVPLVHWSPRSLSCGIDNILVCHCPYGFDNPRKKAAIISIRTLAD